MGRDTLTAGFKPIQEAKETARIPQVQKKKLARAENSPGECITRKNGEISTTTKRFRGEREEMESCTPKTEKTSQAKPISAFLATKGIPLHPARTRQDAPHDGEDINLSMMGDTNVSNQEELHSTGGLRHGFLSGHLSSTAKSKEAQSMPGGDRARRETTNDRTGANIKEHVLPRAILDGEKNGMRGDMPGMGDTVGWPGNENRRDAEGVLFREKPPWSRRAPHVSVNSAVKNEHLDANQDRGRGIGERGWNELGPLKQSAERAQPATETSPRYNRPRNTEANDGCDQYWKVTKLEDGSTNSQSTSLRSKGDDHFANEHPGDRYYLSPSQEEFGRPCTTQQQENETRSLRQPRKVSEAERKRSHSVSARVDESFGEPSMHSKHNRRTSLLCDRLQNKQPDDHRTMLGPSEAPESSFGWRGVATSMSRVSTEDRSIPFYVERKKVGGGDRRRLGCILSHPYGMNNIVGPPQ